MNDRYQKIYNSIKKLDRNKEFLQNICNILKEKIKHFDWVGFYLIEEENKNILVLGPYKGEPTEHTRIEIGEGICGQAADQKETFEVPDVRKENNYLSCSPDVKSEIVVPIFKNYEVIGEIDIDSHEYDPFVEDDKKLLNKIAKLVSEYL
ncbi:MAG: GAF domain-containing protein [Candidatus Mcinerneyibacterium aminivorans]|jgi:GAF domain-containing protein|uniref:GAF domain-containing protein n=1 Tax=Candidatus Mcinerneyibacterium aminivorans TaxID=2703815 RepID=A0A5D0MBT5_9BACT|nr:MAG: GAF domain-containing protein [Candidatus Mcinerneyibacterium aminivorans]